MQEPAEHLDGIEENLEEEIEFWGNLIVSNNSFK